eukprot:8411-Heterococcus_DN1.PRE.1
MAAEMMDGISDQPITTDAQAEALIAANANKVAARSDALGANTNKRKAIDADIESDMEALERQAEKIRLAKIAKTSAYNAEEINLDDDDIDMVTTATAATTIAAAAVTQQSNPEEINLDDDDTMDQDDDSYLSQAQSTKEKDIQLVKKQIPDAVFGDAKAAFAAQQAKAKATKQH